MRADPPDTLSPSRAHHRSEANLGRRGTPGPAPRGHAGGRSPRFGEPRGPPPLFPRPSRSAVPVPPLPSLTAESAKHRSHFLPRSPSDAMLPVPSPPPPRKSREASCSTYRPRRQISRDFTVIAMVTDGRASWPPRPTLGRAQNPLFPRRIRPKTPFRPVRPGSPRPQPVLGSTSPSRAPAVSLLALSLWQHPYLLAGACAGPAPAAPPPAGLSPRPW